MPATQQKPPLIVICGATGIGKTSVAVELARAFGGEIVGADSMQIYRYMDIGTAKPTPAERRAVPHHLVDIIEPDEPFDAARYAEAARNVVGNLHKTGILPFVAGGAGLYIKALTQGIFQARPVATGVRDRLRAECEALGAPALHERLRRVDPAAAERLHPNDAYRILRALEICETTGKPMSAHQDEHRFGESSYSVLKIGLEMDRAALYDRIDRRVEMMLEAGLLKEVQRLLVMGYDPELKAMQSIGYRHMVDYLQGRLSWKEAVRTLKRDTRRYAKRQFTWFRKDTAVNWFSPDAVDAIRLKIKIFLQPPSIYTNIMPDHS